MWHPLADVLADELIRQVVNPLSSLSHFEPKWLACPSQAGKTHARVEVVRQIVNSISKLTAHRARIPADVGWHDLPDLLT